MQDTFSSRPVIRSVAQLGKATSLIVALRRKQTQAEQDQDTELAEVRARHAKKFRTVLKDGTPVSIDERIAQLEAAVTRYTDKHRGKVFSAGGKTTGFPGATLQLRDEAGRIEFADGHIRRTIAASLTHVDGWHAAVMKLLEGFGLAGWIVLVPDLDFDGLKRGLRNGTIKKEEARKYGLKWVEPVRTRISKAK